MPASVKARPRIRQRTLGRAVVYVSTDRNRLRNFSGESSRWLSFDEKANKNVVPREAGEIRTRDRVSQLAREPGGIVCADAKANDRSHIAKYGV